MPAVSIPITILRLPYVESGRRPIIKNSNFTPVYLFLYMYKIANANFDAMGCTWNAGHVICMPSSTSRGKLWTSEKARKIVMKSEIVLNTTYETHIKNGTYLIK